MNEQPASTASQLAAIVALDGSARHPHVRYLLGPAPARRDLVDAIHALCLIHGSRPGLIDIALAHGAQPAAQEWLTTAAADFAGERAGLIRLAGAGGPLPSTPGQAAFETAVAGVNHALAILARSDRAGCATGAAAALIGDWQAIRAILIAAAIDSGSDLPPSALPPTIITADALTMLGERPPAAARGIAFGARQLLAQHQGVWTLLQARAAARDQQDPQWRQRPIMRQVVPA
jgi:hypothetical protein